MCQPVIQIVLEVERYAQNRPVRINFISQIKAVCLAFIQSTMLRGGSTGVVRKVVNVNAKQSVLHKTYKPAFFRQQLSLRHAKSLQVQCTAATEQLELTEENVELVLDDIRPYLMSDGGNVEFVEIDGPVVKLRLQGACGSCPSSMTTMTMGIKRRLMEKIPEVLDVEQIMEEEAGIELTEENVDTVLGEIRPYLVGTGGGDLILEEIDGPIVSVKITGPAAQVMTVRVAVTQKLRERIPAIAAVRLL
eukprot:TRINITY_DN2342_c1_g1_i1.p2 TRINITY_DN2342_c1_g1~~TRINITY_DN2342_c1_g1_i1.p2  ORF type:complete len:248 (+),score=40.79 TRINITY_DN2342_c1_g1_i1:32-775(+)